MADHETSDSESGDDCSKPEEKVLSDKDDKLFADGEGCSHYKNGCSVIAACCNKEYSCRFCHDAAEDHEIDRFAINEVVCRSCSTRQPLSEKCCKCDTLFASYVCLKCCIFDFKDKGQWHCDGCGICRVGGKDNFFHCDKCGYCLGINLKESHRCVPDASKNSCAVCMADLHDSRIPLSLPKCGHPMHKNCYEMLLKNGFSSCPTCKETVFDRPNWEQLDEVLARTLSENPIPESMVKEVEIICNDCHDRAVVKDYLIGMFKCPHCGSYNTQR